MGPNLPSWYILYIREIEIGQYFQGSLGPLCEGPKILEGNWPKGLPYFGPCFYMIPSEKWAHKFFHIMRTIRIHSADLVEFEALSGFGSYPIW